MIVDEGAAFERDSLGKRGALGRFEDPPFHQGCAAQTSLLPITNESSSNSKAIFTFQTRSILQRSAPK